jgi:hypothetical protein
MLSQPATKIFLRTSEPHAAKWVADTIGDVEIERLRESRAHGRSGQQRYDLERQVEPLVMASEVTGLANLRGYLKLGNLVVRLSFSFMDLAEKASGFTERPSRPPRQEDQAAATAAPDSATPADLITAVEITRRREPRRRRAAHALSLE